MLTERSRSKKNWWRAVAKGLYVFLKAKISFIGPYLCKCGQNTEPIRGLASEQLILCKTEVLKYDCDRQHIQQMGQCVKDYSLKYFSCLGAPGGLHHRYFFLLLSRSSWPCSRMVGSHGISLFNSIRNRHTMFRRSHAAWHPTQQVAGSGWWMFTVCAFIYLFIYFSVIIAILRNLHWCGYW